MPCFEVDEKTEFFMREKLVDIDGDSFTIKNEAGDEILKVDGSGMSIREQKVLKDMEDNDLYLINEELVNFDARESHYVRDPESGDILYTLRRAGILFNRNTVNVFEGDTEEGDTCFKIAGSFMEKEFDITNADDEKVAEIERQRFANIITDKDTYVVTVEEGNDAALMIAFAVCVDEIFRDD